MPVLEKLPGIGYDLDQLTQGELEFLYAEFDEELENKIRDEFIADPNYLVDLYHSNGVCPLCGHIGCRYLFLLRNTAGGTDIECGSECIITYGLSVMGAETAEAAKKALEAAIRKQIRKCEIEAWHQGYGFSDEDFHTVRLALQAMRFDYSLQYYVRRRAYYKLKKDLPILERFYNRTGWLGTEKKWASWRSLVEYVCQGNGDAADKLGPCKPWAGKNPLKAEKAAKEAAEKAEAATVVSIGVSPEAGQVMEAAAPTGQLEMTFGGYNG